MRRLEISKATPHGVHMKPVEALTLIAGHVSEEKGASSVGTTIAFRSSYARPAT